MSRIDYFTRFFVSNKTVDFIVFCQCLASWKALTAIFARISFSQVFSNMQIQIKQRVKLLKKHN